MYVVGLYTIQRILNIYQSTINLIHRNSRGVEINTGLGLHIIEQWVLLLSVCLDLTTQMDGKDPLKIL